LAISSSTRKAGPFLGNDATTVFPFAFKVFTAADLLVVNTDHLGVESDLVLDVDYTVSLNSNQDNDPGGSVTLTDALPTDERLTIASDVPALQTLVLTNNGGFYPGVINDAFDKITIIAQQLQEQVDRSLKLPISSTASATLPDPVANSILAWNSEADGFANVAPTDLVTVAAYSDARVDLFDGDGVETEFVLDFNPGVLANLDISISGVVQVPGEDFTWIGTTVTFTTAPPNGTVIMVRYARPLPPVGLSEAIAEAVAAGEAAIAAAIEAFVTGSVEFTAPLLVGDYSTGSSDPGVVVSRNLFDDSTTSGHGFVAADYFRRDGNASYNAFDAATTMIGFGFDHWAGFQDRPSFQASSVGQVMADMYGLFSKPAIDAGAVTRRHGVYVAAPTLSGGGTIGTQHGVYIEALTDAAANWAIYTAGATPSYFGGAVTLNAGIAGGFTAASGLFSVDTDGIATVGDYGGGSSDPGMVISRDMFDGSIVSGHGFVEASYFRRGGTSAFAAFDALTTMAGFGFDHWAAFQDRGAWQPSSGAQVMNDMFGLFSKPSLDAGTVTRRYGAYVAAPTITGGGAITTQYGYYAEALTAGATNWAFYADGTTPSYFGGAVTLNGGVTGRITQTLSANTAGFTTTGYSLTGSNAQTLMDLAGTWNTSAAARVLNISITNTASAATSTLLRAAVNTVAQFAVDVTGNLYAFGKGSIGTTSTTTAVNIAGAPNDNAGMVKIQASSTADNAGITLFGRASGGATNARNWQLANNYSGTGNLDIFRSTSNTGNPTTHVASFDLNGNFGVGIVLPSQKLHVDGAVKLKVYTVATLPTGSAGSEAWVSDATATLTAGIGTVVTGGGSNTVPVGHDGTNWRIG